MMFTAPQVQQTNAFYNAQWAGQSQNQVQQGQDGHTNDNMYNQLNDVFDAAEVVIVTGNPTADIARVGYVNQVTKLGSNQFHRSFIYMHVNPALAARPFFATTKIDSRQNTWSDGVSGPIIKNKTFFYASFNFGNVRSGQYFLKSVPTDKMRGGDLSQLLALAKPVIIKDPLNNNAPFGGNKIPSERMNQLALNFNKLYLPPPNREVPTAYRTTLGGHSLTRPTCTIAWTSP